MQNINKKHNQFLSRFNSINDDDQLRKTGRTLSNNLNQSININGGGQTRKLFEKLQKLAKQQRQKRQQTQQKYESFKQRFINREQQFYKILGKLDVHMPGDSKQEQYQNYVNQIYNKILSTFEAFNQKARQLLDDRYSQLYRMMQRRIDILMQKMDKQLGKYRKISLTQRKQLQQAIKDISVIAAATQNENVQFRKKNHQLQMKLSILYDQKKLLLQQINGLKNYIKKQIKNCSILNKDKSNKLNSVITNNQNQQVNKIEFWKNIQSLQMQKNININQIKHRRTLTGRSYNRYDQQSNNNKVDKSNKVNKSSNNNNRNNNNRNNNTKQLNLNSIDVCRLQRECISQQNIIKHMRQQLNRQKNKNIQLIRFSLQLQTKQQKIKQLINLQINHLLTKTSQKSLSSSININRHSNNHNNIQIRLQNQQQLSQDNISFIQQQVKQKQKSQYNQNNNDKSQGNNNNEYKINNPQVSELNKTIYKQKRRFENLVTQINKILRLAQNENMSVRNMNQQMQIRKFGNNFNNNMNGANNNNSQIRQSKQINNNSNIFKGINIIKPQIYHNHSQIHNNQYQINTNQFQIKNKPQINNSNKPQIYNNQSHYHHPVSRLSNKSNQRYNYKNNNNKNNKQQNHLFINYSPLDLIDITKSIQIK